MDKTLRVMLLTCCAALLVVGLAAGSAPARINAKTTLRIFDPTGHVHAQVTLSGIARRQTAVSTDTAPRGMGDLLITFNKAGRTGFCHLTRGLARRGARLHNHHEWNAFEVNGHIYLRAYVDYRVQPNGLCGAPGFQAPLKLATARHLAQLLR